MFKMKISKKKVRKNSKACKRIDFQIHDFVEGDLLDDLTGGDGHLDLIKVHVHDDNLSITLWFNFCYHDSLQSKRKS